jgi:hypothetical protein
MDINNINALISPFGLHFWDFENAHFEVPKGSGKQSCFQSFSVDRRIDDNNTLYRCRKIQTNGDFFVGPITNRI